MRDFFHGWRRKVGCALLVMAISAMYLWICSYAVPVSFDLVYRYQFYVIESSGGGILWSQWVSDGPDPMQTITAIPYWLLTASLTLLSAYLILWKPRKRT